MHPYSGPVLKKNAYRYYRCIIRTNYNLICFWIRCITRTGVLPTPLMIWLILRCIVIIQLHYLYGINMNIDNTNSVISTLEHYEINWIWITKKFRRNRPINSSEFKLHFEQKHQNYPFLFLKLMYYYYPHRCITRNLVFCLLNRGLYTDNYGITIG